MSAVSDSAHALLLHERKAGAIDKAKLLVIPRQQICPTGGVESPIDVDDIDPLRCLDQAQ
jgi:hypothetical protein